MLTINALEKHPNPLAQHYLHFDVANRLLFTGHSHQAWPDCGLTGQIQAWQDAATFVDKKWEIAEQQAERVRRGFAHILSDSDGAYALGQNTFDLDLRFLSALPLRDKPRIVATDSEFHSLRRLLNRLAEEGVELVIVNAQPMSTFLERLYAAISDKTAAVCCSKVFYNTGLIVDDLRPIAERCQALNCELLVDAYHCLNVVPFTVSGDGLEQAFIVGGGYKYCQLGEGNCFLRVPKDCKLRPVATGWYGEFAALNQQSQNKTMYADGPARFAGATYDPTAHYRAVKVFEFFQQQQLTPSLLREISQHQINLLQTTFLDLDANAAIIALDTTINRHQRGGFLTFTSPHAECLQQTLAQRGVYCDNRANILRLGPAPYLSNWQCQQAIAHLSEAINNINC